MHAHTPSAPVEKQAAAVLQNMLRANRFDHGDPKHPQTLPNAEVLKVGVDYDGSESLIIEVKDPHAALQPEMVDSHVRAVLAQQFPEMAQMAHLLPREKEKEEDKKNGLKAKVEKLIEASQLVEGHALPKELLNWPGFEENKYVPEHGASISRDDGGVTVRLGSHSFEKNVNMSALAMQLEGNKDLIKSVIRERFIRKYAVGNEQVKAAQAKKIDDLIVSVTFHEGEYGGSVEVHLRSPLQRDAHAAQGGVDAYADKEALRDSNLLGQLNNSEEMPILQKLMARAVMESGALDQNNYIALMGSQDFRTRIERTANRLAEKHPEHKELVDEILSSPLLKKETKGEYISIASRMEDGPMRGLVTTTKEKGDPADVLTMRIKLHDPKAAKNKDKNEHPNANLAKSIIEKIASVNPRAADPVTFSKVDSVQLVAVRTPDSQKPVEDILSGLSPVETSLVPAAEQIIAKIEEAHNIIINASKSVSNQLAQSQPLMGKPQTFVFNPHATPCSGLEAQQAV